MKIQKFLLLSAFYSLFSILIIGCATVAVRETLPTFNLKGTTYVSLISLCESKGISFDYDTFTRTVTLNKVGHKINLWVGDTLILIDGKAQTLNHPVDIYQGAVVVPYKFKEQILESLFKEAYPVRKTISPLAKIIRIVVDAGHGGNDPGTIGKTTGLREKDVTLDIAKRLNELLKSEGIEVVMTRSTDRLLPLSNRVDIANNSKADLFISIHANANRVRRLNGFEVYYISPNVSDSKRALSAAESAVLNLDNAHFADSSLNLKAILWDMIYTYSRAESIEVAHSICRVIARDLDAPILGVKGANFQVLRDVRMPAVLIEVGFLSNSGEERKIKNSYYRQKIAECISEGVKDYIRNYPLMEARNP